MAMLAGMCAFMVGAIRHVELRAGWHADEVEAEQWSAVLRGVTA